VTIRRGALIAAAGVAWWWLRPFRVVVTGESMAPTLLPDDCLLAVRRWRPRRGSLVVIEHPQRAGFEVVKRLHGLPGDSIAGHPLGSDEYWVIGEDEARSTDSRSFGPVSSRHIHGVIRARYWPAERGRMFR
jgi:type IV secretory pathway protease TraF